MQFVPKLHCMHVSNMEISITPIVPYTRVMQNEICMSVTLYSIVASKVFLIACFIHYILT